MESSLVQCLDSYSMYKCVCCSSYKEARQFSKVVAEDDCGWRRYVYLCKPCKQAEWKVYTRLDTPEWTGSRSEMSMYDVEMRDHCKGFAKWVADTWHSKMRR